MMPLAFIIDKLLLFNFNLRWAVLLNPFNLKKATFSFNKMHNGHLSANILSKRGKENRINNESKTEMNSFSKKILIRMLSSRNRKVALWNQGMLNKKHMSGDLFAYSIKSLTQNIWFKHFITKNIRIYPRMVYHLSKKYSSKEPCSNFTMNFVKVPKK